MSATQWSPNSWRAHPAAQQPRYDDAEALETIVGRLRQLPPLVSAGEIERLRAQLAEAALGRRFVLQGGDCAERFADCNSDSIVRKLKILLQMSLVLTYGARRPVIRLGRIAGQFAKPRSQETEEVNGVTLPVYRGDHVNALEPVPALRKPDPRRLEQGYYSAAATLNFVRALVQGGFASLRSPDHWQLDFIPQSGVHAGYREIADRIRDAIDYLESLGGVSEVVRSVDFFTSHEGLLLPYEEALTRPGGTGSPAHYNLGAHFLWIGERTRALDGAHVEYFRGLRNPIGIKLGPKTSTDTLLALLDRLDPDQEPGRITLITRMGADAIGTALPPLIRAVGAAGRRVVWSSDPMHGNTTTLEGGVKTRAFDRIETELSRAFEIHASEGSHLAGVHFELTGDNVTECLGGIERLTPEDLQRQYESGCDPRLNYAQSMEMAFLMASLLKKHAPPAAEPMWPW